MSRPNRSGAIAESVGTIAVVLSLVFVGVQIRQNTAAVRTSTSQDLYFQHSELETTLLESADLADIVVRAGTSPGDLTPSERLRYRGYLNLRLNLLEAAYTNLEQGTLDPGIGGGWLVSMGSFKCRPFGEGYWQRSASGYAPAFRAAMDSAAAATDCDA